MGDILTGDSIEGLAFALDVMEQHIKPGQWARVDLYTEIPPTPDILTKMHEDIILTNHLITQPTAEVVNGIAVTTFDIRRDLPYEEHQWQLLIPVLPTLFVVGLIAFGISNISTISSALLPILVTVFVGTIAVVGIIAFALRRPAEKYIERGGKVPLLPATSKKAPGRKVEPEAKYLAATYEQKWVTVMSPGQSNFNIDDLVSEEEFNKENDRLKRLGLNPATGQIWEEGKPRRFPQTERRYPTEADRSELIDLYHLARVPGKESRYDRMLWAVDEFVKKHPEWTKASAYKAIDEALQNPEILPETTTEKGEEEMEKYLDEVEASINPEVIIMPPVYRSDKPLFGEYWDDEFFYEGEPVYRSNKPLFISRERVQKYLPDVKKREEFVTRFYDKKNFPEFTEYVDNKLTEWSGTFKVSKPEWLISAGPNFFFSKDDRIILPGRMAKLYKVQPKGYENLTYWLAHEFCHHIAETRKMVFRGNREEDYANRMAEYITRVPYIDALRAMFHLMKKVWNNEFQGLPLKEAIDDVPKDRKPKQEWLPSTEEEAIDLLAETEEIPWPPILKGGQRKNIIRQLDRPEKIVIDSSKLYHATPKANVTSILSTGLRGDRLFFAVSPEAAKMFAAMAKERYHKEREWVTVEIAYEEGFPYDLVMDLMFEPFEGFFVDKAITIPPEHIKLFSEYQPSNDLTDIPFARRKVIAMRDFANWFVQGIGKETPMIESVEKYFPDPNERKRFLDWLDTDEARKEFTTQIRLAMLREGLAPGSYLPETLLAETEGDPISKFCCRIDGECAPAELLQEGKFPERMAWLRHHYQEKHPGLWGKGTELQPQTTDIDYPTAMRFYQEFDKALNQGKYDREAIVAVRDAGKFPKRTAALARLGDYKILHIHDDGDLTVQSKGQNYVITIEGEMFREIDGKPATEPSAHPNPREEKQFVSDSPEFLAYTIDDIGYREKLDTAFETAIARAKGG